MKSDNRIKRPKKESSILKTKADKIIFGIAISAYAIIMLLELKLTPMHNTISSSIAAFGISAFLISKTIQKLRTDPPVLPKEKLKFAAMPVIAAALTVSGVCWLILKYK